MGKLVGLPEWLAQTVFVGISVAIWLAIAWRKMSKQMRATQARRPSPSREEFLEIMMPDADREVAEFLWQKAIFYLEPHLTPHPDDDLGLDLPIDEDDWGMDWPREWAAIRGFHESNLPKWPEAWPPTLRNYGKWLQMSPGS